MPPRSGDSTRPITQPRPPPAERLKRVRGLMQELVQMAA
jgi:hypothetical protein